MTQLDRKALLQKEKVQIEKVELGADNFVYVRQMSGRERDHFEQSILKAVRNTKGQVESYEQSLEDYRAKLATATMCDADGNMLLLPDDVGTLSKNMSAVTLDKIIAKAQELNKISEADKEELVKNSEVAQSDNSDSASVEN
jgi:hypothetical protein